MNLSPASIRVDALGVLAAVALTLGAGLIAAGPRMLTRGPSPSEQKSDLESRKKRAAELDLQAETNRQRLADLTLRSQTAVRLQPASRVNERLVEITRLAAGGRVEIAQMSPGTPASATPSASPTSASADKAPPAPTDGKAVIVPIRLAGAGSYPDLTRFIHSLRQEFRDTAITSLKINGQPAAPGSAGAGAAGGTGGSENTPTTFTIDLAWYAAPAGFTDAQAKP